MTIGSAGEHTWRLRLWQHLRSTLGAPFTFVGPRETVYDKAAEAPTSYEYAETTEAAFPRAHLAGWGEGWCHMATVIEDAVRTHRADVLLVSLGLIDLGFYTNPEQTADNVRTFVAGARTANPYVHAVILPVLHNIKAEDDPAFAAQVAHFNDLVARTVAELDDEDSPLVLARVPDSWDFQLDTYDGTHPNAQGERRMAGAFADAMHEAWGWGKSYQMET